MNWRLVLVFLTVAIGLTLLSWYGVPPRYGTVVWGLYGAVAVAWIALRVPRQALCHGFAVGGLATTVTIGGSLLLLPWLVTVSRAAARFVDELDVDPLRMQADWIWAPVAGIAAGALLGGLAWLLGVILRLTARRPDAGRP